MNYSYILVKMQGNQRQVLKYLSIIKWLFYIEEQP